MGETDAALGHCRRALCQALELLAGADTIGGGATGKVAVLLDPGDGAVISLLVVLVGLGELGRDLRELEQLEVDLVAKADHSLGKFGTGCFPPNPHFHESNDTKHLFGLSSANLLASQPIGASPPSPDLFGHPLHSSLTHNAKPPNA